MGSLTVSFTSVKNPNISISLYACVNNPKVCVLSLQNSGDFCTMVWFHEEPGKYLEKYLKNDKNR